MAKQKFGKKDIFAPVSVLEKEDVEKTDEALGTPVNLKKPISKPKKKGGATKRQELVDPPRPKMIIHSFRVREDLVEKLREYAFFEKTKIYRVINLAIEDFLKDYKPKWHPPVS